MLWDDKAIREVADGFRELSAGYQAEYVEMDGGDFEQRDIKGNHVALVPKGRAISAVRICG